MSIARGPLLLAAPALLLVHGIAARAAGPAQLPPPAPPFTGKVGTTLEDSLPAWPARVEAPAKAPNILLIMTDDTGFAATGTFGGLVPTPNLDQLAASGLRYNEFHTTALCSPSRAALLTGRNHHNAATGNLPEMGNGYPGYFGEIPRSTATVARILRDNGYSTAMFGKHHNLPVWDASPAGPFDNWPSGLGFEYFYGFIEGDSDQWQPRLYRGTQLVEDHLSPGATLDASLVDDAIRWVHNQKAAAPDKPFFVYLAPGTMHSPHQAPTDWIARFKGKFDDGWDNARERIFSRQKAAGIVPANTVLTPRPAQIPTWDSLTPPQKKVQARLMEVAAATLAYQDAQIGRLLAELKRMGQLGDTLVVFVIGDNGASADTGVTGTTNEMGYIANAIRGDEDYAASTIDQLGGPRSYTNYAAGWAWAMDTPFKWTKQIASHLGGISNGMVLAWPDRIKARNQIRSQFAHLIDVAPTLLDAAGVSAPATVDGIAQKPFDGSSLAYSFDNATAPGRHKVQYFEMMADRAIYSDGWFANTKLRRLPWENMPIAGTSEQWELYDLSKDFSQSTDLAAQYPATLKSMQALFDAQARANNVYPLDGRFGMARADNAIAHALRRREFTYWGKDVSIGSGVAPSFVARSFAIRVEVTVPTATSTGVLLATGSWFGGWSFYLKDGRPVALEAFSQQPAHQYAVAASTRVAPGKRVIEYRFTVDEPKPFAGGTMTISVDGQQLATGRIARTLLHTAGNGETFDIGRDTGAPVTDAYAGEGVFPGAIDKLVVSLGEPTAAK